LKDLIITPLGIYTAVFLLMALGVVVRANVTLLFWASILLTCLSGAMGAILQGGIFGLVAKFPAVYTGALMNGQALAGLLASFVGILTTAVRSVPNSCAGPDATPTVVSCEVFHDDYATMFFFALTALVMATCIMSLLRLLNMPIAEMYIVELPDSTGSLEGLGGDSKFKKKFPQSDLVAPGPRPTPRSPVPKSLSPTSVGMSVKMGRDGGSGSPMRRNKNKQQPQIDDRRDIPLADVSLDDIEADLLGASVEIRAELKSGSSGDSCAASEMTPLMSKPTSTMRRGLTHEDLLAHANMPENRSVILETLSTVASPAAAVFVNFAITIAMFPSIAVHMKSQHECSSPNRLFNDLFVPCLLFLFNVGDLVGRYIAGKFSPAFITAHNVWMYSVARTIFVPVLLTSNLRGSMLPVLFTSDAQTIFHMVMLGVTNGFVASKAMMFAPGLVTKDKAPVAGTIMVCVLTLGLMCGSFLSFFTQLAIRH
jgi:hypothetical protein